MTNHAKSLALMAAGIAAMIVSNSYFSDTLLGWAGLLAGIGLYCYGWTGVCPACRVGRCEVAPAEAGAPSKVGGSDKNAADNAAARQA